MQGVVIPTLTYMTKITDMYVRVMTVKLTQMTDILAIEVRECH